MSRLRVWRIPVPRLGRVDSYEIVVAGASLPPPHPRAELLAEVADAKAAELWRYAGDLEPRNPHLAPPEPGSAATA